MNGKSQSIVKIQKERQLISTVLGAGSLTIERLSEKIQKRWRVWRHYPSDASPISGYNQEQEAVRKASSIVMSHTMLPLSRLASLWAQVRHVDRHSIAGSLVECGVWKGGAAGLMALAHLHNQTPPSRDLHLFDSWEGMPEPRAEVDGQRASNYASGQASGALKPVGQCLSSMVEASDLLDVTIGYPRNLLHYYKGWFQETIAKNARSLEPIALLRLDGDWYDSTKICLEELYPRVSKNGVVVIDDYWDWAGCRLAVDEFIAGLPTPIRLHNVEHSCPYWIKPD